MCLEFDPLISSLFPNSCGFRFRVIEENTNIFWNNLKINEHWLSTVLAVACENDEISRWMKNWTFINHFPERKTGCSWTITSRLFSRPAWKRWTTRTPEKHVNWWFGTPLDRKTTTGCALCRTGRLVKKSYKSLTRVTSEGHKWNKASTSELHKKIYSGNARRV